MSNRSVYLNAGRRRPFNWQLVLLSLTAIALSVASGWTTWDGMSNFTESRWLSLLITFGIQGLMLVSAWLIGEHIVLGRTRMRLWQAKANSNQRPADSEPSGYVIGLAFILVVLLGLVIGAIFVSLGIISTVSLADLISRIQLGDWVWPAAALLAIAAIVMIAANAWVGRAKGTDAMRQLPLWLIFLMCMSASVFFSFDSLFARIFPAAERARASDIRAQRDVGAVLADVAQQVSRRERTAARELLEGPAWRDFNGHIETVLGAARQVPKILADNLARDRAAADDSIKRTSDELLTLQGRRSRLARQLNSARTERDNYQAQRERAAGAVAELEANIRDNARAMVELGSAMEAEVRGVGRTGVAGKGPVYEDLRKSLLKHEIDGKALQEAHKQRADQLRHYSQLLANGEEALSVLVAEIARIDREIDARKRQIDSLMARGNGDVALNDVARMTADLTAARQAFQRSLTYAELEQLERTCSATILEAANVAALPIGKEQATRCSGQALHEALARVAARRRISAEFARLCSNDTTAAQIQTTALVEYGRKCVGHAGLEGGSTQAFGGALSRIELRRDDTAHRFVVSTNAFLDSNQLAFLALAIAVFIDALVFIASLYGAGSAAPGAQELFGSGNRTAMQLPPANGPISPASRHLIDLATRDRIDETSRYLLANAAPADGDTGYSHVLDGGDAPPENIASALNAGIIAQTVRWQIDPVPQYLITPAFFLTLAEGPVEALSVPRATNGSA